MIRLRRVAEGFELISESKGLIGVGDKLLHTGSAVIEVTRDHSIFSRCGRAAPKRIIEVFEHKSLICHFVEGRCQLLVNDLVREALKRDEYEVLSLEVACESVLL